MKDERERHSNWKWRKGNYFIDAIKMWEWKKRKGICPSYKKESLDMQPTAMDLPVTGNAYDVHLGIGRKPKWYAGHLVFMWPGPIKL